MGLVVVPLELTGVDLPAAPLKKSEDGTEAWWGVTFVAPTTFWETSPQVTPNAASAPARAHSFTRRANVRGRVASRPVAVPIDAIVARTV